VIFNFPRIATLVPDFHVSAYLNGMKYVFTLVCLIGISLTVRSQNELTGQVVDSLTRQPVPFANVFFANTSIGAATDEKGEFVLRNFHSGKYDLIVSFVGYKTFERSLSFSDDTQVLKVSLSPEAIKLDEIVVNPNFSQKASDIRGFKKYFLGENNNVSACKIINEKDLVAYTEDNVLIAFARAPLEIRNEALGYKLIYDLENFEVNFNSFTQNYSGIPRFEELMPKKIAQKRSWQDERTRAYEGSFVHLIHNLRKGIVNGPFVLHELHRVPNHKRPGEEFLKEKIKFWRAKLMSYRGTTNNVKGAQDSLLYYENLHNLPLLRDSVGLLITQPNQLLDESRNHITYTGLLHIIYKGEPEEKEYIKLNQGNHGNEQHSVILFKNKGIAIYDNGYYEPLTDVFFDGYMMWSDRISNLLPREYTPGP
jgi:hypothetical protein